MIIRDINVLQPKAKLKAIKLFDLAKKKGIDLELNETLRTKETQMLYYLQGRIDEDDIAGLNKLRKEYGFWEISKEEAKRKVTWTLDSPHFTGRAFDIVIKNKDKNKYDEETLKKVGALAKEVGLSWGGTFGDLPHFQDDEI
jgi:peptidoglycan L-alanyl-D-glutamate endopeptidase CwlK